MICLFRKIAHSYQFSTLYYPTKQVSTKQWILNTYIPIFKQREYSKVEVKQQIYLRIAKVFPIIGYSSYWLFLGSFDTLHCIGFIAFSALYLRQRYTMLEQESKKPLQLFMHKNGLEFIGIYKINAASSVDENDLELRKAFNLNKEQGLLKFELNDIKIVQTGVQPQNQLEFFSLALNDDVEEKVTNRPPNLYEIEVKNKQLLIKFNLNELSGMNEYIEAMLNNKQVVIK